MPLLTRTFTSTRRFSARPALVSFGAFAPYSPIAPGATMCRIGTLPCCIRNVITPLARSGWLPVSEAKKKECIVVNAQSENTYNTCPKALDVNILPAGSTATEGIPIPDQVVQFRKRQL